MDRFRALSRPKQVVLLVAAFIIVSCCGFAALGALLPDPDSEPPPVTDVPSPAQTATSTIALPTDTSVPASPTFTPAPTSTPTPTRTPRPTWTSRPTRTPAPTSTPAPTRTPAPTHTASPTAQSRATPGRTQAQVTRIIDGDTIEITIDGQSYRLRYIGIDTPEQDQPLGGPATLANQELVAGKTVYLEKDVSETDRYDRLLRYVYLADGTFVNAELVRLGWVVAEAYPPDTRYQDLLEQAERQARADGLGMWQPTATPAATSQGSAATSVRIVAQDKRAEYVDIRNAGTAAQDLGGWVLVSEKGNQRCPLAGLLQAGQTLRIWAMAEDADKGGYNCGFGSNIWNNSDPDHAVLYDSQGNEVDRW